MKIFNSPPGQLVFSNGKYRKCNHKLVKGLGYKVCPVCSNRLVSITVPADISSKLAENVTKDISPFLLEKHIIMPERYNEAPKKLVALAKKESNSGVPTGIAKYKNRWYVIQSSGQGPYVIANE
jgi:hypothetical protein